MARYRVSGHFIVGGLDLPPGDEREARIQRLETILKQGFGQCTTIESFVVARQMRPWNPSKVEPDLVEEVTIVGDNREAIFTTYRNDPGHLYVVRKLAEISWVKWTIAVYEL